MQFLQNIWDALCTIVDRTGTIITFFIDSIGNVGTLISKFDVVSDALALTSGVFPYLFITAFSSILSVFIAIRVLRFVTLQG